MESYVRPVVIVSYSIDELRAEAVACNLYQRFSDRNLKTEIKTLYTD